MTQQEIEVFLTVARLGSISAAAQALYITQPAVSRHLRALEETLGCTLVSRSRGQRRVELTGRGRDFVQVAEKWRDSWAIAPSIVAVPISRKLGLTVRALDNGPPDEIIYYLLGPRRKKGLTQAFLACLDRELRKRPEAHSLLTTAPDTE